VLHIPAGVPAADYRWSMEVILDRVRHRINNPYGTTARQQDEILQYLRTVEPLLRRGATLDLDGRRPVAELADVIEGLAHQKA